jgi:hypothetical protein
MVKKHSQMPFDFLRLPQSFSPDDLRAMGCGIIFVFAAWSGPAVIGFQRFTKVLDRLDAPSLDLVVLDTDAMSEELADELFGVPSFTSGGWGEAIWVCDGKVVARETTHKPVEAVIEEHTLKLLRNE